MPHDVDTKFYIFDKPKLYPPTKQGRLVVVNGLHLSWSSVVSAGIFVAMNPWSSTLFRAIACWAARVSSRSWVRPAAIGLALFLVFGSAPVEAQSRRRPAQGSGSGARTPDTDVFAAAVASFKGKLRAVDKKDIVIQSDDDQTVTFHRSKKTKFLSGTKEIKPEEIPLESAVTVDASKDSVGDLVAVDVIWKKL
jgi:hypothetical protein